MPIRYLGIDIGQIQTLDLITARNEVQAKAVLYPEYVRLSLAVVHAFRWSHRRFRQPALSTLIPSSSRISMSNPVVEILAATLNYRRLPLPTLVTDGLSIIVEAPEAGSLGIGTPVLFRGLEVGTVTGMTLGTLSDRVMIAMRISKRYQHWCGTIPSSGWHRATVWTLVLRAA